MATIRRTELQARLSRDDLRNALGETLADENLVIKISWPLIWKDSELNLVARHISYPPLLQQAAVGKSPSAWVVAGPALSYRLRDAETDDEWPARYALVRAVLDWYRTWIAKPIPIEVAVDLLRSYVAHEIESADIDDAFQWASESALGTSRTTRQSLLAKTTDNDALTIHEYIQDEDARSGGKTIRDVVWFAALEHSATSTARNAIGVSAALHGNRVMASKAWIPLAEIGDAAAMNGLGVLLQDSDPGQARHWYERAAEAGHAGAMNNLGLLLRDRDPEQARRWFEKAVEAGHQSAGKNLKTATGVAIHP